MHGLLTLKPHAAASALHTNLVTKFYMLTTLKLANPTHMGTYGRLNRQTFRLMYHHRHLAVGGHIVYTLKEYRRKLWTKFRKIPTLVQCLGLEVGRFHHKQTNQLSCLYHFWRNWIVQIGEWHLKIDLCWLWITMLRISCMLCFKLLSRPFCTTSWDIINQKIIALLVIHVSFVVFLLYIHVTY